MDKTEENIVFRPAGRKEMLGNWRWQYTWPTV